MSKIEADVVVIGAGNAAFCAALAAQEHGASVCMFERAPKEESGGNSRFTAGAVRYAYNGIDDLRGIIPDLSNYEIANSDFGIYSEDQFFDDMYRLTRFRTEPNLCETLVKNSRETMAWMLKQGIRFMPMYGRQAFKVEGRFKFWGGLTLESWGGGPGLVDRETELAQKAGIEICYGARAVSLITDRQRVI